MHELEPYYRWLDYYESKDDDRSPLYGRTYSEFEFSNTIYNFYIHPQWDYFGSNTLYLKILYANYEEQFCIIELIGEWNDCLNNDIMFLKRDIIDPMIKQGIQRFILIGENVLNFHASDDCYYEEWFQDIVDEGGWIAMVNFRKHVIEAMQEDQLHFHLNFNEHLNDLKWRKLKPLHLYTVVDHLIIKALG
ncbi:MAG: hypothetical protein WD048_04450 [Chitinophagales bacterium]